MSNLNSKEIIGIEKELELLIEQTNRLKKALIIETDAAKEFQYEEGIKENELKINVLKTKLSTIHYIHSSSGAQLVLQKINEIGLEIETMGEQDLISVDREAERQLFFDQFDQLLQSHFQFYFISGCPTQMPHSFSEWAILEIAFKELEEKLTGMLYRRRSESNRVQIFNLPVGRNLEKSKRAFKKFFAEYFKFKQHVTFDKYIETGLPSLNYEYVAFVFDYDATRWLPFHKNYFKWIINTFQRTLENMPTFLFFFVLTRKRLHHKQDQEYESDPMVRDLDGLASSNNASVHISPLRPVPVLDLERWFRELGERNPARIEEVVELLVKGLKQDDKKLFAEKKQFNMDDIERLQGLIYEWYLGSE